MPDIVLSIPAGEVARAKPAWTKELGLDPNISNVDLFAAVKAHYVHSFRAVVRNYERDQAVAAININTDAVVS